MFHSPFELLAHFPDVLDGDGLQHVLGETAHLAEAEQTRCRGGEQRHLKRSNLR